MEALRIIIKEPKNGIIHLHLPEQFKRRKLEIIVIPFEEEKQGKEDDFEPQKFRGIWKDLDIDVEKVCREMREECERF